MSLTGKQRADLRAEAHHLQPLVHVGHQGLTETVRQAIDDALRTRELVKLTIAKHAELSAKDAATELGVAVRAEVIQVIGRTVTLFRHNPDIKQRADGIPPWR